MKNIFTLIILLSFTFTTYYDICGYYRCDHSGKSYLLELDSNNIGVIKTVFLRSRYFDTIEWRYENDMLYFNKIDTNYVTVGDSLYALTLPNRALYSDGYILFYYDNYFLIFYNTKLDTCYKDEFFYTLKRISGEEAKIINQHFGDTVSILKKLGE